MPVKAIAKGVKHSPRKVNEVASLVRGRTIDDALVILSHTPRRSALAVKKVIESARANADYNHNYIPSSLRIVELIVSPGPRLKRYRPIARGSANPFMKRSSHIRVVVDGQQRQAKNENLAKETTKLKESTTKPTKKTPKTATKNSKQAVKSTKSTPKKEQK